MENQNVKNFPRYERYKDSGVDWIGEVPEIWQTIKMQYLFKDISIKNKADAELLSVTQNQGVVPRSWVESRMVMPSGNLESFKYIQKGDFAISLRSFEGGLEYCYADGIISPAYTVLKRDQANVGEGYFKYLFKSSSFISELQLSVVGIREGRNVSYPLLSQSIMPLPLLFEQTAIAQFLDHKTAQIDRAIAIKEEQIKLLNERKQIMIQEAVTKGLDPTVPMKDSGVQWIGEIPEHWEVKKLKTLGEARNGLTYSPADIVSAEEGVLVLRASNIRAGKLDFKDVVYVNSLIPEALKVKENDLLICSRSGSRNLIGKNALITKKIENSSFGAFMMLFRSGNNNYLYWLLNSKIFEDQSGLFLTSTINQLTLSVFNNIKMPIPSEKEQELIIAYLGEYNKKILQSIESLRNQIQALKEYKTTLINEAVTGKIKVN